ncbi:MAG: hypothetical protein JJU10_06255 [Idiomarina sp.]|nr:hypothetical protein [Idiomarina sp.]
MIVTRRISLWKLLVFTWPKLIMLAIFVGIACVLAQLLDGTMLKSLSYASGFLGTALAFLIGFRNNTAYSRWWEGHGLWSQVKYESRNFALEATSYLHNKAAIEPLLVRAMALPWVLNQYLRKAPLAQVATEHLATEEWSAVVAAKTPPQAILQRQADAIGELARQGELDSYQQVALLRIVSNLGTTVSGCERLKKTPFPMQYNWFMNYTLAVFLLILPMSLAGHLGNWSIPLAFIIGYAYIMLEYVGRYIEKPFENEVNDVPMDYIARTIEIDLLEALGRSDLPAPIAPRGKGYLY